MLDDVCNGIAGNNVLTMLLEDDECGVEFHSWQLWLKLSIFDAWLNILQFGSRVNAATARCSDK